MNIKIRTISCIIVLLMLFAYENLNETSMTKLLTYTRMIIWNTKGKILNVRNKSIYLTNENQHIEMNSRFFHKTLALTFFFCISLATLKAQSVYRMFARNHHGLEIASMATRLEPKTNSEYLESPFSLGFSAGYERFFYWRNFSGVTVGGRLGFHRYKIQPTDNAHNLNYITSRVMHVHIPVLYKKYYPVSNKYAFLMKSGVSINSILTSLSKMGGMEVDDQRLFETSAKFKSIPQVGVVFGLGAIYTINKNNFLALQASYIYNFFTQVHVSYDYYLSDSQSAQSGDLYGNGSFLDISLYYKFNAFKNR